MPRFLNFIPIALRIEIKERKPFALWQKDGRISLIAADGAVLETAVPSRFSAFRVSSARVPNKRA